MAGTRRPLVVSLLLLAAAVLLQTTLLPYVAIRGVKPDLVLIILVFVSIRKGAMTGQVSGFAAGLVEDFLSLSPLGFHAFFRTCIGFFYGLTAGNIFIDPILMPPVLVIIATLFKGLVSSLLTAIFALPAIGFAAFHGPFWIELGYTAVLAPFCFAALGLFKALRPKDKDEV
jgi:rod shape-determining protein MreD